jgi:(1->4)-alpha-D-glucan 1-alpha-D-glucosylmutase
VAFRDRVAAWQEKAVREAKRHSEWAAPNAAYEDTCREFLAQCLDPERTASVARELAAFAGRIAPAGAVNGLAQTLLRLTSPGVPDLYQGTEFWDFSLVDPDNRRPVDWAARQAALVDATVADWPALAANWQDGRIKQAVIARTLALREAEASLFALGSYVPLRIEGPMADHALAFARVHGGRAVVVAVSRLIAKSLHSDIGSVTTINVPVSEWHGTAVLLPRNLHGRRLASAFGRADVPDIAQQGGTGRVPLANVFAALPVALLEAR